MLHGRWLRDELRTARRGSVHDATTIAHLSQFYQHPRFQELPDALRFEQLHAVATHYAFHFEEHDRQPRYVQYPGGRGGEAGRPPIGWEYVRDELTGHTCSLRSARFA